VAQGYALIDADGRVEFSLPPSGDIGSAAIKVMTWNGQGMHYGHFPLASLGGLGVRPQARQRAREKSRLRVRREGIVLEKGGQLFGLDGRSLSGK
jgi:hypothetical protein